jgi:hypothetical protein
MRCPVLPASCVALLLCFASGGLRPAPRVTPIAWQQTDPKRPSQEKQPADSQQKQPSAPAAKPAAKPKKVITNDDLEGSGSGFGFSSAEFSQINDCDRSCFRNLQQSIRIDPAQNPHWRRDVLRAIDLVRKDAAWQRILHDVYDLHLKTCDLQVEKQEELAKAADPANVTPQEVDIEEKYEVKFRELQEQLNAVRARQSALKGDANDNPVVFRFRIYQENRLQGAPCAQPAYRRYPQSYTDDP